MLGLNIFRYVWPYGLKNFYTVTQTRSERYMGGAESVWHEIR